jgi:hypothetical protein
MGPSPVKSSIINNNELQLSSIEKYLDVITTSIIHALLD